MQWTISISAMYNRYRTLFPYKSAPMPNFFRHTLTDGIFETGAHGVPSKSQNPTILSQGGPSGIQC